MWHYGSGDSNNTAETLAILTPSLALHLVRVCSTTALGATYSGPVGD